MIEIIFIGLAFVIGFSVAAVGAYLIADGIPPNVFPW